MSGRPNSAASPRLIAAAQNRARLAEYVANGGSFVSFAAEQRISTQGVRRMWRTIREEMGAQAV